MYTPRLKFPLSMHGTPCAGPLLKAFSRCIQLEPTLYCVVYHCELYQTILASLQGIPHIGPCKGQQCLCAPAVHVCVLVTYCTYSTSIWCVGDQLKLLSLEVESPLSLLGHFQPQGLVHTIGISHHILLVHSTTRFSCTHTFWTPSSYRTYCAILKSWN